VEENLWKKIISAFQKHKEAVDRDAMEPKLTMGK
jgi:hypothetical protein